jgi:rhamnosyltransferase
MTIMSETISSPASVTAAGSAAPLIGALVVLYRPTPQQLTHLFELCQPGVPVVVVDNSPVAAASMVNGLATHGIAYLRNANRGGIAGAYNRGLTHLFERGVGAVALFDQDSRVSADYFRVMRESCTALGARPYAIGPRIYDENIRRFLPQMYSNGFSIRTLIFDAGASLQPCSFLLSSGCVISRLAYERLGAFAEPLFIDHVDTEYSLRALLRGVPFYVEPRLILSHRIGEKRQHLDESPGISPLLHGTQRHAPVSSIRSVPSGCAHTQSHHTHASVPGVALRVRQAGEALRYRLRDCRRHARQARAARSRAPAARSPSGARLIDGDRYLPFPPCLEAPIGSRVSRVGDCVVCADGLRGPQPLSAACHARARPGGTRPVHERRGRRMAGGTVVRVVS